MNEHACTDRRQFPWRRPFANRQTILILRYLLGATFLVSSFGKLVNIEEYSVARVYDYQILPGTLAIALGWSLPFIELLCALGLICGVLTRLSALGITIMSASFFAVKAILLAGGRDFNCGCFGAVATTVASVSIYMDPVIFLMSLTVLFAPVSARDWLAFGNKLPCNLREKLRFIW